MRRNKIIMVIMLLCLCAAVSGCYDRREVEDMAYVIAIGVDIGVNDGVRLSFQLSGGGGAQAQGGAGQKGAGNPIQAEATNAVYTIDAPSLYTGLNQINTFSSKQLNLEHAKMIIFSEEIAKSGILKKYLKSMVRYREIRKISNVVVVKGNAEEFLKANVVVLTGEVSKVTHMILNLEGQRTGFFPVTKLMDFYIATKSNMEDAIIPLGSMNRYENMQEPGTGEQPAASSGGRYVAGELPRRGGQRREFFGTAVFRGAHMVGELNGDETRVLSMVRGDFKQGFFTMLDPQKEKHSIALDVRLNDKPKITVDVRQDPPVIHVRVTLEGDFLSIQSGINYESSELKPVVEEAFAQNIKDLLDQLIKKCQHEYKADIFRFGTEAVTHFSTIGEWEQYEWLKKFTEAQVTTEVSFIVRRTGTILKSTPVQEAGEKE
ncbi:Ger(x)C family spore germination protein [Heliophilum fasciatum]|uniref:Spore germination protein KC n=1 Tax=Heliophilum fasciatum TaxID=35700 RepID=A0A4R2RIY6_9FIRM|nr:Ger(x)C family spore germination protein [Heliophilum fasciatum]MCW2278357.1 spore germination protein KC [Heliophilum fasciatum]TCP63770.1 spore germination protein KC [Heliophilum fasciatum]